MFLSMLQHRLAEHLTQRRVSFCHSLDLPGIKFTLISSSKSFNWNTIDYKGNLKLSQGYSSLFIRDMFHVQDDLIR